MSTFWLKSTTIRVCASSPANRTSLATRASDTARLSKPLMPARSAAPTPSKTLPYNQRSAKLAARSTMFASLRLPLDPIQRGAWLIGINRPTTAGMRNARHWARARRERSRAFRGPWAPLPCALVSLNKSLLTMSLSSRCATFGHPAPAKAHFRGNRFAVPFVRRTCSPKTDVPVDDNRGCVGQVPARRSAAYDPHCPLRVEGSSAKNLRSRSQSAAAPSTGQ